MDVWKKNVLEDLELENLEYEIVEKFLMNLKKEFREEDEEAVKIVELKRLEQRSKIIKEFVQKFRRAVRESKYEKRPLMEEFK